MLQFLSQVAGPLAQWRSDRGRAVTGLDVSLLPRRGVWLADHR
jgi:hypothetical protein